VAIHFSLPFLACTLLFSASTSLIPVPRASASSLRNTLEELALEEGHIDYTAATIDRAPQDHQANGSQYMNVSTARQLYINVPTASDPTPGQAAYRFVMPRGVAPGTPIFPPIENPYHFSTPHGPPRSHVSEPEEAASLQTSAVAEKQMLEVPHTTQAPQSPIAAVSATSSAFYTPAAYDEAAAAAAAAANTTMYFTPSRLVEGASMYFAVPRESTGYIPDTQGESEKGSARASSPATSDGPSEPVPAARPYGAEARALQEQAHVAKRLAEESPYMYHNAKGIAVNTTNEPVAPFFVATSSAPSLDVATLPHKVHAQESISPAYPLFETPAATILRGPSSNAGTLSAPTESPYMYHQPRSSFAQSTAPAPSPKQTDAVATESPYAFHKPKSVEAGASVSAAALAEPVKDEVSYVNVSRRPSVASVPAPQMPALYQNTASLQPQASLIAPAPAVHAGSQPLYVNVHSAPQPVSSPRYMNLDEIQLAPLPAVELPGVPSHAVQDSSTVPAAQSVYDTVDRSTDPPLSSPAAAAPSMMHTRVESPELMSPPTLVSSNPYQVASGRPVDPQSDPFEVMMPPSANPAADRAEEVSYINVPMRISMEAPVHLISSPFDLPEVEDLYVTHDTALAGGEEKDFSFVEPLGPALVQPSRPRIIPQADSDIYITTGEEGFYQAPPGAAPVAEDLYITPDDEPELRRRRQRARQAQPSSQVTIVADDIYEVTYEATYEEPPRSFQPAQAHGTGVSYSSAHSAIESPEQAQIAQEDQSAEDLYGTYL
jgi:hypothetical protein